MVLLRTRCLLPAMQSPPAPPRTQAYAEPYAGAVEEYGAAWKVCCVQGLQD